MSMSSPASDAVHAASPGFPASPGSVDARKAVVRLGVLHFLNTLPLIDGLDRLRDLELRYSVPSLLIDAILNDEVEAALCSSIDYQAAPEPLVMLPVGLIGCNGPTLTVRLYSSIPLEQLTAVHCDTDSHTSVALLRILLAERFGIRPELIPYHAREHVANHRPIDWPEAMLLIGDKVVTDSPPAVRYPHQLDLGEAWRGLTGLPFVFATWMAKASTGASTLRFLARTLDRARRANAGRIDAIAHASSHARRWPGDLAEKYLGELMVYAWTPAHRAGLEQFHDLAFTHGLIPQRRPLVFFEDVG